uniref:NADH-ubiquinone oxidoreductase chain 4 n=2 Tax=Agapornis TaxID=60461 RepID=A0A6B8LNT7_AGAPE|nr:NADH dehydrogenase subunit 4 [Agapornis nigrigenis]YP_009720943.1 NADH dehydrogenase subunit 4 [Agapornis pullarius]YP_009720956.1 NADH dehydrogenase subunit 4 [Agapornis lilianae]QCD14040.1 NADH dehydrogenase subunit 4 [Agapornis fischeri]QGM79715.1 NADH dehydrogenase subunit 4 [Agapornis personatus]QGM79702.1 NADH dehydrogenase subunit 4 [Agapornis nigrigenis]QGM79728.1 NADH dehydrogenase subunit 4 [Agapornis lilianae]
MLKILLPSIMLLPTALLSPLKSLWVNTTTHSLLIATLSLHWLTPSYHPYKALTKWTAIDHTSSPLLVLSCWLTPLMILASQAHLQHEPPTRKRIFAFTLVATQPLIILAFSATELTMFYTFFEATLIPTLILITRWGSQPERLSAGIYLLFYTLISSLPLLIAILFLHLQTGTLHFPTLKLTPHPMSPTPNNHWSTMLFNTALLLAFMVKAPLYGLHLWLPKAHVEAPIAGSMLLAALLLKLGGYGIMRITHLMAPFQNNLLHYPFMTLALWGALMTSSICLRQMDLKSLIAYSSVSHMGLVIAASMIQTHWSFSGAMILMVSHGLTSSMLFCLANTNYERTHSRILFLAQGLQPLLPLMATWWLLANLTNMALPPSTNLMAELTIMIALFNWSPPTILLTGPATLLTALYTLFMLTTTQRGPLSPHITTLQNSTTREHLLMALHLLPTLLLILKPELISGPLS